ncbi:thioredoxin domain-containing protein [Planctomycetota bacterium]|nr:thioredoxin domain-containing protein [Planctomycetota bacterium]
MNRDGEHEYTNRLVNEGSLYLRQHAHNPVDWWAWSDEAFEEARRRDVPLLVSVGYSTCYWCHVMEREVFENERMAELMNEKLVCVKVDREERGDVDAVYMVATQVMTGSGGWPMNVFLDHEGRPFYCGTYFPAEGKYGRPGFGDLVNGISDLWANRRLEVEQQATKLAGVVKQVMEQSGEGNGLDAEIGLGVVDEVLKGFDVRWGGIGERGPKFPQAVVWEGVCEAVEYWGDAKQEGADVGRAGDVWDLVRHTLGMMCNGGLYDQLGGGFHRYSVDREWVVPHFEKMGYDQGQLLSLYARGYELEREEEVRGEYERVMRESCEYLMDEMRDEGSSLFYSAQDAEVDGLEGGNYVWDYAQVREAVGDEDLVQKAGAMFGLEDGTNFQDPHHPEVGAMNVLVRADLRRGGQVVSEEERVEIVRRLKAARDERKQPVRDEKILTGWNGLIAGGLADVGRVLGEEKYIEAAGRCVDSMLEKMVDGDEVKRVMNGEVDAGGIGIGMLEDYALLMRGMQRLIRAGHAKSGLYLQEVERLCAIAIEKFGVRGGGYFDVAEGREGDAKTGSGLFVRVRSVDDGAMPSGASAMVGVVLGLYEMTLKEYYAKRVVRDLRSYADRIEKFGGGTMGLVQWLIRAERVLPIKWRKRLEERKIEHGGEEVGMENGGVIVRGERVGDEGYLMELEIGEGLHVNGHGDFAVVDGMSLVPTEVGLRESDVAKGWEIEVKYPDVRMKEMAGQMVGVYEELVRIEVRVAKRGGEDLEGLVLQYQVCSDNSCMAPVKRYVEFSRES